MTQEQINEAVRLRETEGLMLKQIIERVGGTESVWIYHFARLGVERGGRAPIRLARTPNPLDPTIKQMRLAGASYQAIGRAIQRPPSFVAYRLHNMARRDEARQDGPRIQGEIAEMLRSGTPICKVAKALRRRPAFVSSIRRSMTQSESSQGAQEHG